MKNTSFSLQSIINQSFKNKDEKKKITAWYASGLGSCATGRYLERLGNKPDKEFDARTLRVFSAGKFFEEWALGLAKKQENIKIETQVRIEDKELNLTGYADAVIEANNEKLVYELKTKNSRAFFYMDKKGEGASEHQKMQLWAYLWKLNISEGRLLYIEKDALCTLEYPVYLNDEELKEKVLNELKTLNKAWNDKIPPQPITDTKDWRYRYCRWHKQCLKTLIDK